MRGSPEMRSTLSIGSATIGICVLSVSTPSSHRLCENLQRAAKSASGTSWIPIPTLTKPSINPRSWRPKFSVRTFFLLTLVCAFFGSWPWREFRFLHLAGGGYFHFRILGCQPCSISAYATRNPATPAFLATSI